MGTTSSDLDIFICIMPKVAPEVPTVGPAILKSHILAAGFTCEVADYNIKLYHFLKDQKRKEEIFFYNDGFLASKDPWSEPDFLDFYNQNKLFFDEWIEEIERKKPRFLGLSLLSQYSGAISIVLTDLVREKLPHIKIVWGGPLVDSYAYHQFEQGKIDYFINGDGEVGIVEVLKGNDNHVSINNRAPFQNDDFKNVLPPNYDDILWGEYVEDQYQDLIYITGSRGCVRSCNFCNVNEIWPRFRYRSAADLADEIRLMMDKYGRKTIHFTDSLINGSQRVYFELLEELIKIKKEYPDFSWVSQWIIKSKERSPELEYQMLQDSGCERLEIGLESFTEKVRYHMGKRFSNEDVDWCMSMLIKYKIKASYLMFVGYPTETEIYHQERLQKIKELHQKGYLLATNETGGKLMSLCFGSTMILEESLPLWKDVEKDLRNHKNIFEWDYFDNTFEVRLRWLNEVNNLVKDLKQEEHHWTVERDLQKLNRKFGN